MNWLTHHNRDLGFNSRQCRISATLQYSELIRAAFHHCCRWFVLAPAVLLCAHLFLSTCMILMRLQLHLIVIKWTTVRTLSHMQWSQQMSITEVRVFKWTQCIPFDVNCCSIQRKYVAIDLLCNFEFEFDNNQKPKCTATVWRFLLVFGYFSGCILF